MRLPVSPARSQMAVIRASRTVCDRGDGSGTEEEINKRGCLRADAVSKPTTTDLSAQREGETEREVKINAECEREGKCERLVGG